MVLTGQSRAASLLEAAANVAAGWGLGLASNLVVLPAFGVPVALDQAAGIAAAFSLISLGRSYAIRRIFNRRSRAEKQE